MLHIFRGDVFVAGVEKFSNIVEGRSYWGPANVRWHSNGGGYEYARKFAKDVHRAAESAEVMEQLHPTGKPTSEHP